jgi:hypothetical protein
VQALTELRVILPGAQALFGFQVSAVLIESFDRLSSTSRTAHLASMVFVVGQSFCSSHRQRIIALQLGETLRNRCCAILFA